MEKRINHGEHGGEKGKSSVFPVVELFLYF
jgi:hypothetical protein